MTCPSLNKTCRVDGTEHGCRRHLDSAPKFAGCPRVRHSFSFCMDTANEVGGASVAVSNRVLFLPLLNDD